MTDDLSWFAVQSRPRQEERVRFWLHDRGGMPVFLPMMQVLRRRRSRRATVIEPLFPSYLFVQMRLDADSWHTVKWCPGVRQIVATGDVPTPVPSEVIAMLRERCDAGGIIPWRPRLRTGATVTVVHGPFAGIQGILDRPGSRRERVRVLLKVMGCLTPVEMDVTDIEFVA